MYDCCIACWIWGGNPWTRTSDTCALLLTYIYQNQKICFHAWWWTRNGHPKMGVSQCTSCGGYNTWQILGNGWLDFHHVFVLVLDSFSLTVSFRSLDATGSELVFWQFERIYTMRTGPFHRDCWCPWTTRLRCHAVSSASRLHDR